MVKKTILTYFVILFVSKLGIGFCGATYATFLLYHHCSLLQINLVNAVFFGTMLIVEIPTGIFADVYGRKSSVLCSCACFTAGFFWYGISHTMEYFMIAEILCGFGWTFSNGALQAWFVDIMKELGFKKEDGSSDLPTWLFGIEYTIANSCGIAAGCIGGIIADKNLSYPWFVGSFFMACSGIGIFFIMHESRVKIKIRTIRQSISEIRKKFLQGLHHMQYNLVLKFLFIIGMINMFVLQVPNMQWQPFFTPLFSTNTARGILFAGMMTFLVIGSVMSMVISKRIKNHRQLILYTLMSYGSCILLSPICVMLFGTSGILISTGFFLLHEMGRGFWIPIRDAYMHSAIPSQERATLVSVTSVFQHAGGLCGLIVFGFFANTFSMNAAWICAGSLLIITSFVLLVRPRL